MYSDRQGENSAPTALTPQRLLRALPIRYPTSRRLRYLISLTFLLWSLLLNEGFRQNYRQIWKFSNAVLTGTFPECQAQSLPVPTSHFDL